MQFLNAVADLSMHALGSAVYKQSLDKLLATFNDPANADATITMTVQRRRFDGNINGASSPLDEETITFGMKKGQSIDKVNYPGFEGIFLDRVTLKPNTKLAITNANRFMTEALVCNGTTTDFTKTWTFPIPHPNCFEIKCVDFFYTGSAVVDDNWYLDSRFWGLMLGLLVVVIVILAICFGKPTGKKEKFQGYGRRLTMG